MASDSTTDEQACRRDRRGPGGAPAAKRGRTTLTPRSSGAESIRLSCRHVQCRWCRTKISHPREGEEGAGSAAQACLRRVARHGAFRATPDGLNHLDGVATSKKWEPCRLTSSRPVCPSVTPPSCPGGSESRRLGGRSRRA